MATATAATATTRTATLPATEPIAAGPRDQSVRVVEQASDVEPSTIPDEVREYFKGRGYRLVPACVLPQEMNRRSRGRSYPLRVDELTESPGEDGKRMRRLLQQAGFTEKENIFRRSDTTIYMQPLDDYTRLGEDARTRWLQTLPNDALAATTLADIAGEEFINTGLIHINTREELTRRTP